MSNERVPLIATKEVDNFPLADQIFTLKSGALVLLAMVVGSTLDRTLDYLVDVLVPNATKPEALKVWWIYVASSAAFLWILLHTIETCRHKHSKKQQQQQQQTTTQGRYNASMRGLRAGG